MVKIGPDLVYSAVTAPATAAPGGAISLSDTTKNEGVGSAEPSTTTFYLSRILSSTPLTSYSGLEPFRSWLMEPRPARRLRSRYQRRWPPAPITSLLWPMRRTP